ncbi:neural cell adhesion molecule 1 isoform X7 isoform B [Micractinium conductrix]|uniref:Neural cell adhesion molecule 1 isoform X7 isoform B n=1 Tax=Micractinium conductrix TaxID=554055 RepID=A0A2P6V6Q3_9CHLO|nr:neural cell adhesion molecule 1 isoform X7 isoform B [Micractinium conductrix]|eukprot:PSC69761.1 neural cell adhesion molecule 1 isoform X7 isoform B [Micractinium conductrix]
MPTSVNSPRSGASAGSGAGTPRRLPTPSPDEPPLVSLSPASLPCSSSAPPLLALPPQLQGLGPCSVRLAPRRHRFPGRPAARSGAASAGEAAQPAPRVPLLSMPRPAPPSVQLQQQQLQQQRCRLTSAQP